ncbi:DUF4232 domain-containing protein [Streptomyces sp. CBMA29]|uniref:DUF4232 domain-containing protein n=1 Tax=Streptomyces sp. CBMA29 TaxID=1896314 RepID=UPI0016621A4E|nr:DUF4232 domain-containing protein [Streptomyces sp. CBMA29]MBD0737945.1 hypothetical protein [Streptomyces sp. CBMA29]
MRSLSVRVMVPAAALATAALTLTACSDDGGSAAPAGSSVSVSAAPSESSSAGAPSTTDDGTQSAPGGTPTSSSADGSGGASAEAAGPNACASDHLSVALKDAEVGAGQYHAKVVFTNTGSTACTLTGYPGVSYVKTAGAQAGPAADRDGASHGTVSLAPKATAYAELHDSNGQGGYSADQCALTKVEGLRIYPPNQKAALFLADKTEHCAGTGIHPLTIGAVRR